MTAMIEAEAAKRWCPLVRASDSTEPNATNRDLSEDNPIYARCIGSACMAWRWSRAKETAAYLEAVQARMKTTSENFNVATQKVYADIGTTFEHTEGFCGAFGKPE